MKNKDKINSLRSDFTKLSTKIFRMGLDATTIAVYAYCCSCTESFNPSLSMVAKHSGVSKSTARRCLDKLVERNVLYKTYRSKGKRTRYELTNPDSWLKEDPSILQEE